MNSNKFSLRSRFGSLKFAFRGIRLLLKNEHNSRIHLIAAIAVFTLGLLLHIKSPEWVLLIIVTGIVFLTELLNSSLEKLSDLIDPELNEQIRNAKDYAAAAVLISAIISVIVGGLIFIPRILEIFLHTK